ncbi:MAG: PA14 domain-containing protein, partial [Saprospiraceae bacterium]|nr:PA14 domain-containing protein [Saprospiraceae bacterium]
LKQLFLEFAGAARITGLETHRLSFTWWREPLAGVPADRFATLSATTFTCQPGVYRIITESDDGIMVAIDGSTVIENWDVHTPELDTATVRLGGTHSITVQHFDNSGLAVLDFSISPIGD